MSHTVGPIALTMGEPSGIGGEITIKAWKNYKSELWPFFLIDDPKRIRKLAQTMALEIKVKEISNPSETTICTANQMKTI